MKSSTPFEVVVAGAGPAGLALAGALASRDLAVAVVDPRLGRTWEPTYGAFLDDVEAAGLVGCVARAWSRPLVFTGDVPTVVPRAYAVFDNEALRGHLADRARGAAAHATRVVGFTPRAGGMQVRLDDGGTLETKVFVDATGAGTWVQRRTGASAQVALGRVVELASSPWSDDEAVWMDLRGHDHGAPSFLYALPLGGGRVLVEETSLASSPPMPWRELETRLDARIAAWGLDVRRTVAHERVFIPLDRVVPAPRGPVVGFGAAGGMVHPSTGYSVVRAIRAAPAFAAALAEGLAGGSPEAAAQAAHAAVWSWRARATRSLHEAGLRVLLSLDGARTRRFFDAFFALPAARQAAWLDGASDPVDVALAMSALFASAPWGVRSDVLAAVLDPTGRPPWFPVPRPGGPT